MVKKVKKKRKKKKKPSSSEENLNKLSATNGRKVQPPPVTINSKVYKNENSTKTHRKS